MTITKQDLENFHRFADERLSNGLSVSITQLAKEWEDRRESEDAVADILESEADIEAGRVHSAQQVFEDVRNQLGLNS